jgi:hypothetical protein
MSWCSSILDTLKAFNPLLLSIIDASICPLNVDWDDFLEDEGKCMQQNAQATYLLTKAFSSSVEEMLSLPLFVLGNPKTKSIEISSQGTLGTRRCI